MKTDRHLLYDNDCFKPRGYNFYNVNQLTINIISDRCNMTFENYNSQQMSMCEKNINMNIARNAELINSLDRNKNHPLIAKYFHIPFNI